MNQKYLTHSFPQPGEQSDMVGWAGKPVATEDMPDNNATQQPPPSQLAMRPPSSAETGVEARGFRERVTGLHVNPLRRQRRGENPPTPVLAQETEADGHGSFTLTRKQQTLPPTLASTVVNDTEVAARKSRTLPPALSSTVVNDTRATAKKSRTLPPTLSSSVVNDTEATPVIVVPPGALPHGPFELQLPTSIPKPSRISGFSLQRLMLLQDHKEIWNLIRRTVRKHMDALSIGHRQKHRSDGKPDGEWRSPWIDYGKAPTELISMLCRLVRQDPSTSFMSRYEGDWGTREVAKTCCKYTANQAIRTGEREPRPNYRHTAENSAKRNPDGLRGPRYGKSALRKAQSSQARNTSQYPNASTNLSPSPLFGQVASDLGPRPQPQLVPSETSGLLSAAATHLPHIVHPHPAGDSTTTIYPRLPPHVVDRRHGQSPFATAHQSQEPHSYVHHQQPHLYSNSHPAFTSQATGAGLDFHPGQHVLNPALMENVYHLKPDRSPSPLWNANDASGSGNHYGQHHD